MPVARHVPRSADTAPRRVGSLRKTNKVRIAATASIALGASLFGVSETARPAGAQPSPQAGDIAALGAAAAPDWLGLADASWREVEPVQPRSVSLLEVKPVHVSKPKRAKQKAPATPAVISGLAANGIPSVALNAYRVAAARVNHADTQCGIDWPLLAAIGRVESDHGRFAGANLLADGTSDKRIVGPALDGKKWDLIPAPANGMELAGDAVYAHALGPMQFIPSTWDMYGADANGDGKADVFNINDAALAAARYLCTAGGDLRTRSGRVAAVLAYNHNDEYLAQVLALASAYRMGVPVTGIPVGNVKGELPPVKRSGQLPPVNPATPTAAEKAAKKKKKAAAASPTPSTGASAAANPTAAPSPTASATATGTAPAPSASPSPTSTATCNALAHILLQC